MADEPLFQQPSEANQALDKETRLPMTGWQQEVNQGLEYGLEAAESIRDRTIPPFLAVSCPTTLASTPF
jgi:agmatinase